MGACESGSVSLRLSNFQQKAFIYLFIVYFEISSQSTQYIVQAKLLSIFLPQLHENQNQA